MKMSFAKIFTTAALGFSFGTGSAQQSVSTPDTSGIAALKAEIAETDLGRQMLKEAALKNVSISYEAGLSAGLETSRYVEQKNAILIDPQRPMEDRLEAFAYAFKRATHKHDGPLDSLLYNAIDPRHVWAIQRYQEADAHAFAFNFIADRAALLQGDNTPEKLDDPFRAAIVERLRLEKTGDRLSEAEYRDLAVTPLLSSLQGYDEKHWHKTNMHMAYLQYCLDIAARDISKTEKAEPPRAFQEASKALAKMPTDADVERQIRRLGRPGLNENIQSAFQDTVAVPTRQVLEVYPFSLPASETSGLLTDEPLRQRQEAQAQFEKMKKQAKDLQALLDKRRADQSISTNKP